MLTKFGLIEIILLFHALFNRNAAEPSYDYYGANNSAQGYDSYGAGGGYDYGKAFFSI